MNDSANSITIVSPANHTPAACCERCGRVFAGDEETGDERIVTLHVVTGPITVCRPCYSRLGNDVR